MGIFDYFKRLGRDDHSSESAAAAKITSRRYHMRYQVGEQSPMLLEHSRGGVFRIIDISFNGCLIQGLPDATLDPAAVPFMVDLTLAGRTFAVEVRAVHKRRNGWALVFQHGGGSDGSLITMSKIIEPLQFGASAIEISPQNASDSMKSRLRRRYSGEGPFDLLIERDSTGKLNFAMVTMRRGAEYGSVIWEHDTVVTKLSQDGYGVGARMAQTAEPDQDLIWNCAVACAGVKFPEGPIVAGLLSDFLSK